MRHLQRSLVCVLGVFLVVACNSVLDIPEAHLKTDEIPSTPAGDDDDTTNNGECGAGKKSCNGRCVNTNDPETGCGNDSCDPCNADHGTPSCNGGECAITCDKGFGDCDTDPSTGCESDLSTDKEHCSSCTIACGAGLNCIESVCQCREDGECGDQADGCGSGDDDRGRCYCPNNDGEPCAVGAACDGRDCAF